jgi:cobalt-zinc-cadmium efflux system outer membrane protein
MSIRQLRVWGGRSALWSLLGLPLGAFAQTPLGLEQVLGLAGANLEVNISQRNLDAARADILSANHAPLPVLSARTSSIDLQNGIGGGNVWRDKRIDKGLGLDFTYERGNKRQLRTQAAQSNAQAAEQDLAQTRRQQLVLASATYFDWLAQVERLGHLTAVATASRQQARAAELRQQAGDLSRQDMLRWQIEARRAEADVPAAQAGVQRAALALRQILRLPAPADGWVPAQGWPEAEGELLDPMRWSQRLSDWVAQRPAVMAAQQRAQAARQTLDLALAQKKSDVTWGGSVDHYPGTSTRLLELRLQMPLQWNYSFEGEIARAQAQATQSEDLLEQTRTQAQTELQALYQDFASARARWHAHRDEILPKARQVLDQAELAYQKGGVSLTDLLDARRTYHNTWLDGLSARLDHAVAYASLVLWSESEPQARQRLLASTPPAVERR